MTVFRHDDENPKFWHEPELGDLVMFARADAMPTEWLGPAILHGVVTSRWSVEMELWIKVLVTVNSVTKHEYAVRARSVFY